MATQYGIGHSHARVGSGLRGNEGAYGSVKGEGQPAISFASRVTLGPDQGTAVQVKSWTWLSAIWRQLQVGCCSFSGCSQRAAVIGS